MTSNLVQLSYSYFDSKVDDKAALQSAVGFHRRGSTIVNYVPTHKIFEFYRFIPTTRPIYEKVGVWDVGSTMDKVVGIFALECYDLFAFVGLDTRGTLIALLDLTGNIRAKFQVSVNLDLSCAEYNNNTREFLIGFNSGAMVCLYLKIDRKHTIIISRKKVFTLSISGRQVPIHISSQDLLNSFFVLSASGHICNIDSTTFEVTYAMAPQVFAKPPTRVYADKFGTGFVVQCTSSNFQESLEFWRPPEDYATCRDGYFTRHIIPISGQIIGITFETVGLGRDKTLLCIGTSDKRLQLWSSGADGSVFCESDIQLNISKLTWKAMRTLFTQGALRKDSFFPKWINYFGIGAFLPDNEEDLSCSCRYMLPIWRSAVIVSINSLLPVEEFANKVMVDFEQQLASRLTGNAPTFRADVPSTRMISLDVMHPVAETPSDVLDQSAIISPQSPLALHSLDDSDVVSQPGLGVTAMASISETDQVDNSTAEMNEMLRSRGKDDRLDRQESSEHKGKYYGISSPIMKRRLREQAGLYEEQCNRDAANVPHAINVKTFFPAFFKNQDTNKSTIWSNKVVRFVLPHGIIWDENDGLLAFTHKGRKSIESYGNKDANTDLINIKHIGFSHRAGLIVAISEHKECIVYNAEYPSAAPLKLALAIRQRAHITELHVADIELYAPEIFPLKSSTNSYKKPSAIVEKFSIIWIGDSEGFAHMFVCSSELLLLQSTTFLAHQSGVKRILTVGDISRPLWMIGTEHDVLTGITFVRPVAVPGSCVVTVSQEGEVKSWQPFSLSNAGKSFENILIQAPLQWKVSGLFIANQVGKSPITGRGSILIQGDKVKWVESVTLAPSNMHLLIGYNNGHIEEWHIPGLLKVDDALSTSQSQFWSSAQHNNAIVSLRVYVHGSLSKLKKLAITSDHEKDKILASSCSYLRTPAKSKYTIGWSFQEVKGLVLSSSMVSCSSDKSMVLWGFEQIFQGYCSLVIPYPCKKFYFSCAPKEGLSFATSASTTSLSNAVPNRWIIMAVVNNCLVTIQQGNRTELFEKAADNFTDNRNLNEAGSSLLVNFEDDTIDGVEHISKPTQKKAPSLPVISSVFKPANLVASTNLARDKMHPKDQNLPNALIPGSGLFSLRWLDEWAKVYEKFELPAADLYVLSNDDESDKIEANMTISDENAVKTRSRSASPTNNRDSGLVLSRTSPVFMGEMKASSPELTEQWMEDDMKTKFICNGVHMVAATPLEANALLEQVKHMI